MTTATVHCIGIDLGATRTALTDALSSVPFQEQPLRVNAWLADVMNPPCALVGTFDITWEDNTYNGLPTALVPVRLVVPGLANRPAQQELDELLAVYADALFSDPTLGGVVKLARPLRTLATTFVRGSQEFPCSDATTLIVF